jgi:hypothetical protein
MNVTMTGAGLLLLAVQVGMCAVLGWSVLCRATRTNGDTRREVRWAMAFEGFTTGLLAGAPFLPVIYPRSSTFSWQAGTTPAAVWILFLLSILLVQLATAKYWREGVPAQLQLPARGGGFEPAWARRRDGLMAVAAGGLAILLMLAIPDQVRAAAEPLAPPAGPDVQSGVVFTVDSGDSMVFSCLAPEGCVVLTGAALQAIVARTSAAARCSGRGL